MVLMCTAAVALAPRFGAWAAQDPLAATLARMDEHGAKFKTMKASIQRVHHVEVIHEDETEVGSIWIKRSKPKELKVLMEIQPPNPKVVLVDGKNADVYYPNNPGEIQRVELGRQKSMVDQYLTLGFGGNSTELQSAFIVRLGGTETVVGVKTTRLELTPKTPDPVMQLKRIDLWIADEAGYTVQQKLYEQGKDYSVITFTKVEQNPAIADTVFKLPAPKGTKREVLIKK
jgi:outer membrane lipoprotein-sorting protein